MRLSTRPCVPLSLLLVAFLATGCAAEEDEACPGHYTVLQGQMTIAGGTQPLAHVPLEVVWLGGDTGFLGRQTHEKARGHTDGQGRYRFRFLLGEDEAGVGALAIRYAVDESKYLVVESRPAVIYPRFGGPPRRDTTVTTVTTDYRVARLAWLQGQVNQGPGSAGSFASAFRFSYGADERVLNVDWLSPTAEFAHAVPGDVPIQVATLHIRGGVRTETVDTLVVPAGATRLYPVRF
jgi:hypothetical protein